MTTPTLSRSTKALSGVLAAALALSACASSRSSVAVMDPPAPAPTMQPVARPAAPARDTLPALKDVFKDDFLVGVALNEAQFSGEDPISDAVVKAQFNAISPENTLKWEVVHPRPGVYDFSGADKYVAFGERNHMFILGHNLIWHSQTPKWVFEDASGKPVGRDTLLARMRDHIMTVVGRYKGRIDGWDVVNEALNEDGTLRQSPWLKIIGPDYIAKAFQFAHEADPSAQLYYNDYSLANTPKRQGAIRLIRQLQSQGIPVAAVGMQGHVKMDWPSPALMDSAITDFAKLGIKVNISELDVDLLPRATRSMGADVATRAALADSVNPYRSGLPDSVQQALARRYAGLFQVFVNHAADMDRVTFWNVTDRESWLNNWPVPGRTAYPLLFDRNGKPKPAFFAVVRVGEGR
ncbi:MAG TPA: endo-1,4-beta-xylanase [Longimicrobiaceae bacterium]|nr:endo-1,4-beta-xylanase [Longimicrobiaceae bacterium]